MSWSSGETIVVREVWRGRLWSARPVIVVEDTSERLVYWCPSGTHWKVATTPPSRPRLPDRGERFAESLERMDWVLGDLQWQNPSLEFVRPGEWLAVRLLRWPSGEHRGWYVNLQRPFSRSADGISMMDMMLDLVIQPDRSWAWKDEDEIALLLGRGILDDATVDTVRAAGHLALERLGRLETPFDDSSLTWEPRPGWTLPELPENWSELG